MGSDAIPYIGAFVALTGIVSQITASWQDFSQALQAFWASEVDMILMPNVEWL